MKMTTKLNPIIQSYIPLVKGIAATFGSRCEVVLHDFTDLQHSIVAIENGHVTGRSSGSPMTESSLKLVQNGKVDEDIVNYTGKSADGRVLKSTTVFIKDEHQKVIGCFCINFDITELVGARSVLNDIMKISEDFQERPNDAKNLNVVSVVLTDLVKETLDEVGKPIIYLSKDDKVMMVDRLDQKGAFLIKGAIDYVANVLCVSRYTIYNYLDEIRETK
ncbi:Predicted transcriptional regulator YheO, contains PAS and DNA-binding HTH domains [Acidaminobacter hydrogenoformans DSM 2784]|uniref:Predicted transcriptional regulator YheO, contains PAS and DNA-binding HTH domains n=2 Tax=Acidaminobacter TaxID=65402 RepID=A0A1G5RSX3_9FIRM|nr:Predicted transcriptional regulator YheO, contains PAS and DNA-binding HTH domains [Acidaminobacter hydrogenoformans DSM 2784]